MNLQLIRSYLSDFFLFLKRPSTPNDKALRISTGRRFWMAYLTQLCVAFTISIPLLHLIDRFLLRLRLNDAFEAIDNLFVAVIAMVLIAPVVEELLFRYPLKFVKPRFLKFAIYISSIVFGLIHLSNYKNDQWLLYVLAPLIVSSQSLGGFVLAYLRLREGLLWSMFSHALFNATLILFGVVFYQGHKVLEEKSETYTLTIREYSFKEGKSITNIYRSEKGIDSIVWRQTSLQALVDSLSDQPLQANHTIVDVALKTNEPISADHVIKLIKKEFRID